MMKTLLSVDFDFFVPEYPEWDMGHEENLLFLDMIWSSRVGLIDTMTTDGNEKGFWNDLDCELPPGVMVSDGHCMVAPVLGGIRRVVLFDAHHDCWKLDEPGKVYSHNWLRAWLNGGRGRTALWVKPAWQKHCDLPRDMKSKVDVVVWEKGVDLGLDGVSTVHVCRSGCWVPPWLDGAFTSFVKDCGRDILPLQLGAWNPMRKRWNQKQLEDYQESCKETPKIAGIVTGSIKSSDFMNSRTEKSVVGV